MAFRTSSFYLVLALVAAALIGYSETRAFAWDEGFHVLTAQLILHGKRPYIDFCFSQTPLNAYWNALLLRVFGESWRPLHAAAALESTVAIGLTAAFVRDRFPVERWRFPGAILTLLVAGLNVAVIRYGGLAQAYGICLLGVTAAFRFAVASPGRRSWLPSALAGLASGIAAASSLLTAPAIPIYLAWILLYDRQQRRTAKAVAFLAAVALPFLPVLWLFVHGPQQVFFGIVQYNFSYRLLNWPGATEHNLGVYGAWINTGPVLLLILLAIAGLLFTYYRAAWAAERKAEFYLCAWLAAGLAAYVSYGKPTFERYYVFTVPFLAILAVAGLYTLGTQLYKPDRPWAPILALSVLAVFGVVKDLIDVGDNIVWPDLEKVAQKVGEVTTPQQTLYADEAVYFLARRTPPSGLEMDDSHKFNFSPERSALLHVIWGGELKREAKAGRFDAVQTCEDDDYIADHGFVPIYAKSAKVDFCTVFWDLKPRP